MTDPYNPEPGGHQADNPAARDVPLVTWQEAVQLAYRLVELPAENNARATGALPPVDWIARPTFASAPDLATPQELEEGIYRLAETAEEDRAKVENARYVEARLKEMIAHSRRIQRPGRNRGLLRETHWYECLLLPLMAWKLLLGLAAGLSLATVWLLPFELNSALPWHIRYLFPVAIVAYACGFLQCVFSSAVAGDPPAVSWPGRQFHLALRYLGWWLFCILAGPAPLLMAAVFYWIYCGDLEFLDWLILTQAGLLAVGYWLFALLAVTSTKHLYSANPIQVAVLVRRMGYRSGVAILVAFLLVIEHARLILNGIRVAHESGFGGWVILTLYWLSALAAMTFLLRLLGWWWYCQVKGRPQT